MNVCFTVLVNVAVEYVIQAGIRSVVLGGLLGTTMVLQYIGIQLPTTILVAALQR